MAGHRNLPGKEYDSREEVSFETRAVAFIDILGWRKAVEDSVQSSELRRTLLNAVWALGSLSKKDAEDDTPDHPSFDQATQFSDSVIISIPYLENNDLARLIRQITNYQGMMLMLGLPLRGGITIGPLYHNGSLVFGPALNEAYHLENKLALNPRVIISKELSLEVEAAARSFPQHWPFVVRDEDGFYSTDYMMMYAMNQWTSNRLDERIDLWLSFHRGNTQIHSKYEWLKSRWEATKVESQWRVERSRQLRETFNSSEI